MQVDFSPLPATGEMAPAEMPPSGGPTRSTAPRAGGGRSDSGNPAAVDRQKDFHETMDDLLRAESSGKARNPDAQISAKASGEDSGEDSGEVAGKAIEEDQEGVLKLPEGTLLEIAARIVDRLGMPAGNKGDGGAVPQSEAHSKGGPNQGDPDPGVTGESAKTPLPRFAGGRSAAILSGDGEVAVASANKAAVASEAAGANKATIAENTPNGASESPKPEVMLSRQIKAMSLRDGAPAQEGAPKGGVMPAASEVDHLTEGATAGPKGADLATEGVRKGMEGSSRLSPTAAGIDAKAAPMAEGEQFASSQNGPGSQPLPKGVSVPTATQSVTTEEGTPQSFASLVESMDKSGGGGNHFGAEADTSLDTVGLSGNRGHITTPNAPVDAARGESAATQTLPKEEVVQQIVNSARLRLGSGQSEMRIQLKPEHLGRVQLNIATEQQQVVVKVVADLPMVKELLESNLHQLRTELQGQGLEIHKFDVSVGGDSGTQNREQQAWGQQPGGRRGNAFAQSDADKQEKEFGANRQHPQPKETAAEGVDYFA